mmetsp:Transcript_35599/g.93089  ORF Transcript_35599/g.93089 Transcript_35599/m.93089 type:complete len:221 (-) Transcript_35599:372-1034(-)
MRLPPTRQPLAKLPERWSPPLQLHCRALVFLAPELHWTTTVADLAVSWLPRNTPHRVLVLPRLPVPFHRIRRGPLTHTLRIQPKILTPVANLGEQRKLRPPIRRPHPGVPPRFVQDPTCPCRKRSAATPLCEATWHRNRWLLRMPHHPDTLRIAKQDGPCALCSSSAQPLPSQDLAQAHVVSPVMLSPGAMRHRLQHSSQLQSRKCGPGRTPPIASHRRR